MKTIRISVQKFANSGKRVVEYLTHNHKIKGLNPTLTLAERKWQKIIFQLQKFANSGKTVVEDLTFNHKIKGLNSVLSPAKRENGKK